MEVNADGNMEAGNQSTISGENESIANVDRHDSNSAFNQVMDNDNPNRGDISVITNKNLGVTSQLANEASSAAAQDRGNIVNPPNKGPDETILMANTVPVNTDQVSNDTLEKDLAADEQQPENTARNPFSGPKNSNNQKIRIISDEVITIKQIPHHSKPFKKRSLSVDLSLDPPFEFVKKPKQTPAQVTGQNTPKQTENSKPSNPEEKIKIQISKVKLGPKTEYTIKNSNNSSPIPNQVRIPLSSNEIDNSIHTFDGICKQVSEINNQATILSNFFKELNTSLDENTTSCKKIHSLMDDLLALYSDGFNYSDSDSDDYTTDSDEDNQEDSAEESRPETTSRMNSESDTKWTLKYQKKELNTTELITGSGVYISKTGLVKCRNMARSATLLAKMLMKEIFTGEALVSCSFTGYCVKVNGVARPPLDPGGTKALLDFVSQFSLENDWDYKSPKQIKKNLNSYLSILRRRSHI